MTQASGNEGTALRGLAVQRRVIGALVIREMQTRFGRDNIGFLWMFVEPLILVSAISAMHAVSGQQLRNGLPVFIFYAVSYGPFYMFRSLVSHAAHALTANRTLLYHRQVTMLDVMVARNFLGAMAVVTVITIIIGVASWITSFQPANPAQMALAMLLMFLLAFGLAMVIASLCGMVDLLDRFVQPMTYLSLPLSGAFTAMDWLPVEARETLLLLPLAHVHEFMREAAFGAVMTYHYDLGFVLACIGALNLIGLAGVRAARFQPG